MFVSLEKPVTIVRYELVRVAPCFATGKLLMRSVMSTNWGKYVHFCREYLLG